MAKQTAKFKKAVAKAKSLYKTGRYKNFGAAVKAAYKKIGKPGNDSSSGAGHTSTSTKAHTAGNKTSTKTVTAHIKVGKRNWQTGTSVKKKDQQRKAKAPGKRRSRTGGKYTERRKNRSDVPGKLTGVTVPQLRSAMKTQLQDQLGKALVRKHIGVSSAKQYRNLGKQITEIKRKLRGL